jgi:hypothetical protein
MHGQNNIKFKQSSFYRELLTIGLYKGHRAFSVRYEMNLHVRGIVHGEATLNCQHGWFPGRCSWNCLKLFPLVKSFVSHLFYSYIRNVCVLMLRDVSRGFPEPPRRITMYCLETGYDHFLSDPFVSTCDYVQWPRAARSISLRLSLEQMRERPVLPSASIARTVLPQAVNRSMHRPAHRVTAWQKRDWNRVLKLAHMKPRLGVREVCILCIHCQIDIAHRVKGVRTLLSNVTPVRQF